MLKIADSYSYQVSRAASPTVNTSSVSYAGSGTKIEASRSAPTPSISSLSVRLSSSDASNEKQLSGLGAKDRANFVVAAIDEVSYALTPENISRAQAEVPRAKDSDTLKLAKEANAFVNSPSSPNPFASLSGDQLSSIYTDNSGNFTINERRAAYTEAFQREEKWRIKVAAEAAQEYNNTGKLTKFFEQALEHFESLSQIEKYLYPEDYAADLQAKIRLDFNYLTGQAGSVTEKVDVSINSSSEASEIIKQVVLPPTAVVSGFVEQIERRPS